METIPIWTRWLIYILTPFVVAFLILEVTYIIWGIITIVCGFIRADTGGEG